MKIQHIISTMNRKDFSFLESLCLKTDALVVNQNCPENKTDIVLSNNVNVRVISTPEKGLSRSRNMLINNAEGEILVIGDDDVEYLDGYYEAIENAYNKYPDADIIVFRFTHKRGKETRTRYMHDIKMNMMNISKAASVEISFRRQSILDAGVRFNNNIGLGTDFPTGEENAFLADALRAGLKIYHVPKTICVAQEAERLTETYNISDYIMDKGASYHCIYKKMFPLYSIAFIILKKKSIFKDVSIIKALSLMCKGKKKYKETTKE